MLVASHRIASHRIAPCSAAQCSAVQRSAVQCSAVQRSAVQCRAGWLVLQPRRAAGAFAAFAAARIDDAEQQFRIRLHGTYNGERLAAPADDDLPAGPCGQAVNQVKLCFYGLCRRLDCEFESRQLSKPQRDTERRLLACAFNRD